MVRTCSKSPSPGTKIHRMMQFFASGASLHTLQSKDLGEHDLRGTISKLGQRYGLVAEREDIIVPNRFGGKTKVKRYWFSKKSREQATALLMTAVKKEKPELN